MSKAMFCIWLALDFGLWLLNVMITESPWREIVITATLALLIYLTFRRSIEAENIRRFEADVWCETERLLREKEESTRRRLMRQKQALLKGVRG